MGASAGATSGEVAFPPVIDLAPVLGAAAPGAALDGDDPATAAVVAAIADACTHTGFFVVVGHGLDAEIDAAFDVARRFFALPQADKEAVPRVDRYGYRPHVSTAIDTSRAMPGTESIDLGLHDESPLPPVAGAEEAIRSYQRRALEVAGVLLRTLALGLGIDQGFFAQKMNDPQCRLRLLHYPPLPLRDDGSLPVPNTPHTDYGGLTLLATDGVPGLEVRPIGGEWTPVAAPDGALVVNVGDMIARWTGNRYVSTPHRVVGSPERHRISIPFFVNPDPDVVIETIDAVAVAGSPRYTPVSAGAFLAARIDGVDEPYVDPAEGPVRRPDAPPSDAPPSDAPPSGTPPTDASSVHPDPEESR